MKSVAEVIDLFGGVTALAGTLAVPVQTVSAWKQRGSIPSKFWLRIEQAARATGADLGLRDLALICTPCALQSLPANENPCRSVDDSHAPAGPAVNLQSRGADQ